MAQKLTWTTTQDNLIRGMREARATWEAIAASLGSTRSAVIERGRRIGAYRPPPPACLPRDPYGDPNREALRPGDPRAWDILTENTLLAGSTFKEVPPCAIR